MEHGDARRDPSQGMDDVFDPDDRRPFGLDDSDDVEQRFAFRLGQPAGDLVEEQQSRRAGKRLGKLEPL